MKTLAPLLLGAAALCATAAHANGVRSEKTMSLEIATQIAAGAVADCQAKGHAVSATVVDRGSSVRVVLRADNAGAHTLPSSERKAFTAASIRVPTQALMENAQKNPGAANLVYLPGVLLLGGGVPVKAGDEVIGAVGVGGAPSGAIDEQCALAGIEKAKDLLK